MKNKPTNKEKFEKEHRKMKCKKGHLRITKNGSYMNDTEIKFSLYLMWGIGVSMGLLFYFMWSTGL